MIPVIIGTFVLIIAIIMFTNYNHEKKIHQKIESIDGKVLSISHRNIFNGLGPFMVVGKGRTVYSIDYKINGDTQIKEGWVRFGGLFGPDWRL